MKIKFIKEYVAFYDFEGAFEASNNYKVGEIKDVTSESAQWLIDNGFAEKVEEQWPTYDDLYWYISSDGVATSRKWTSDSFDRGLKAIGNIFKTGEPAHQFINYLKAVEVVRHDEGFMTRQSDGLRWNICLKNDGKLGVASTYNELAGAFCFEWNDDAKASIKKHPDEWRTILNYKWGEE